MSGAGGWFDLAERLEEALRAVAPGKREIGMAAFGRAHKLTAGTLRSYSAARRHLAIVAANEPSLVTSLRSAPVDAVAILARWHSYDPNASLNAARMLAAGEFSVRKLKRKERLSRPGGRAGTTPKMAFLARVRARGGLFWMGGDGGFRIVDMSRAEKEFGEKAGRDSWGFMLREHPPGGAFADPTADERRDLRIDLFAGSDEQKVAILLVGPYNVPSTYLARCPDWLLKATGVAKFYKHVALILPGDCRVSPFARWLKFANNIPADEKIRAAGKILLVREKPDGTFEAVGQSDDEDDEPLTDDEIEMDCDGAEHGESETED